MQDGKIVIVSGYKSFFVLRLDRGSVRTEFKSKDIL